MAEMNSINRDFLPIIGLPKNVFFMVFGRQWIFQPALYDRAAVEFPMVFRNGISGVGRSSIDLWQTLEDEADGSVLASMTFRMVNIDPVRRGSSVALPEDIRKEALRRVSSDGDKFPKFSVPDVVPTDAFSSRTRVRYDDMDVRFHTNQGSYLGFALECASRAAESGYYSHIREDVAFRRARRTTGVHLAESHAGDDLNVSTWQDANNQLLLHFAVFKQGHIIYYAQVDYSSS
jgi:acyl-CoA thioesterase FadM